ncbi:hypothetical protein SLOPH_1035 [Spraguea lophii 42_110]|uniref:Uncharacterized protein n=1 Tax=Spraguea lophii (strain 42_110) TaxID=1358809 RepID=S7W7E6_SPRLO|nr:hypothetical protein SLOPH_1035 [Spraguea lophii 42_110]
MDDSFLSDNAEIKVSNKTKNTGIYTDRQKRKIMLWNKESAEKYKKLYNNGDGSGFLSSDDESYCYEDNERHSTPKRDISGLEEKLPLEFFTTLDSELFSNHIQDINIDDNIWNRPSDLYSLDNDMPAENFIGDLNEKEKSLRKYKKGLKNVFLERYTHQ